MNVSDFARRHGYREDPIVFEATDFLPPKVRADAGMMLVKSFEHLFRPDVDEMRTTKATSAWPHRHAYRRFAEVLRDSLPASESLLSWYQFVTQYAFVSSTATKDGVCQVLVQPLLECDWRLFYEIVQNVWAETHTQESKPPIDFAPDFNFLLRSHGIPWVLQGGWVTPAADYEFAGDLKYVRDASNAADPDQPNDPHVLLKDALDALYSKQGGPNIAAACANAWGAWKAAAGEVSGQGPRDKRAFDFVKSNSPMLHDTMNAWQKLAQAGRHPETEGSPNESETRFIVMLCVNAVRFLMSTRDNRAGA